MRSALLCTVVLAACQPSEPPYLELSLYLTPERAIVEPIVGSDGGPLRDWTVRVNGKTVPSEYLRSGSGEWRRYSEVPIPADHRYRFEIDDPGAGLLVHEVLADEVVIPPVGGEVRVGDRLPFAWTGSGTPAGGQGLGSSTQPFACVYADVVLTGARQAEAVIVRPLCSSSDPADDPYGDVTLSLYLSFFDDPVTHHRIYGSVPVRFVP